MQDFSTTIRFKGPGRKNLKMTATKKVTFWLVKGASVAHPFLIDDWAADFEGTLVGPHTL